MKQKNLTGVPFDGKKFATRYSLGDRDFWCQPADGTGAMILHFPDSLPDDPICEAPTLPKNTVGHDEWLKDRTKNTALFDDAAWGALTSAEKVNFLRSKLADTVKSVVRGEV